MNNVNIQAILRQLSVSRTGETDGELLSRFVADRNEAAFTALVNRHGRLVWSVCRHLAGPDADDSFQATFLILLRKAATLGKGTNLPAWLHRVAFRICLKAQRAAKRRFVRERASVDCSGQSSLVPDSVWDRTLRVVHEEVVRLPDSQRIPFVLCCLEGKSVSEAATQLGWKLGTLSGRLSRAKDSLIARLLARDVVTGAGVLAAIVGTNSSAPAETVAKTLQFVQPETIVASSVLHLSQGVIGMSVYQVKCLAAGILVACGLGLSGGAGWIATSVAQTSYQTPAISPDDRVRQLEAQLQQARREAEEARKVQARTLEGAGTVLSTAKWQYSFVPASRMDANKFVKFLEERESHGWNFRGQMTLQQEGKDAAVWVFNRPLKNTTDMSGNPFGYTPRIELPATTPPKASKPSSRNETPPEARDRSSNFDNLPPKPTDTPAPTNPLTRNNLDPGAGSQSPPANPNLPKNTPPLPNARP